MSETRAAYGEKQAIIDEIKGKLTDAQSAVVVDYIGITVDQANSMRKKLREADVDYTVYKNTLLKRAIEGTEFAELESVLTGPSAIAISNEDATAPARVLSESIKDFEKMAFKGGVIEGEFYDADGLKQIAKIPSRDVLLAKFLGSIQSPVGAFVRTLAAIAESKGSEEPAAEAKAEEKPAEEAKSEEPVAEAKDEAKAEEPATEAKDDAKAEEPAAEEKTEE